MAPEYGKVLPRLLLRRGMGRERAGGDTLCAMARDKDEVGLAVEFAREGLEGAVEGDFAHGLYF